MGCYMEVELGQKRNGGGVVTTHLCVGEGGRCAQDLSWRMEEFCCLLPGSHLLSPKNNKDFQPIFSPRLKHGPSSLCCQI